MNDKPAYVFDFEGNGLEPTKIHVVSKRKLKSDIESTNDYNQILEFWSEDKIAIGHNIASFDIPWLSRLLGCEFRGEFVDTLYLSWYLWPVKTRHGLEEWGEDLGYPKVQIDDWHNLTYDDYKHRCERDVEINTLLWEKIQQRLLEIYGDVKSCWKLIRYLMFKAKCASQAEHTKIRLDVAKTRQNLDTLNQIKEEKRQALINVMPMVPVYRTMKRPARERKADNSLSVVGERWWNACREQNLDPEDTHEIQILKHFDPPNPNSHDQIKSWLFDLGWEPCTFRTNDKKQEVPQINNQDPDKKGELAPSVLNLLEEHPEIEPLEGLFTVSHRISILEGFLEEADEHGFLSAQIAGLTNTLRFKHKKPLVNLPSMDKPYGEYIRSCLIARDGKILLGSDMSSLEDRTKQHYMYYYDPKYVEEMNTPDFDPHLDIGEQAGLLTHQDVIDYKNGVRISEIKPIRHSSKTTNYSCTYGAFPPKIAKSAGIGLELAQKLWNTYWERNWSIKKIAEDAPVKETSDGQKWLLNPVSGFWYSLRHDKDRFSTLNQGTGSYCFDTWLVFVLQLGIPLLAQFHDEFVSETSPEDEDKTRKLLEQTIIDTNNTLQLNRQLDIGIETGTTYGDIH